MSHIINMVMENAFNIKNIIIITNIKIKCLCAQCYKSEQRNLINYIKQEKEQQHLRHPSASKQLLIYLSVCTPRRSTKQHKQQKSENTLII